MVACLRNVRRYLLGARRYLESIMIQQSLLIPVPNAIQTNERFTVPFKVGDWVLIPVGYSKVEPLRAAGDNQYPLYVENVSVCGTLLRVASFAAGGAAFWVESKHARFLKQG